MGYQVDQSDIEFLLWGGDATVVVVIVAVVLLFLLMSFLCSQ